MPEGMDFENSWTAAAPVGVPRSIADLSAREPKCLATLSSLRRLCFSMTTEPARVFVILKHNLRTALANCAFRPPRTAGASLQCLVSIPLAPFPRSHRQSCDGSSSPAPCPTPTATSTSAIWSSTCRPTSGSASRSSAGSRCIYICADDTHGTAIMIRARQEGITRGGADRQDAAGPRAPTSPASTSSSTTTAAPTARRTAQSASEIWAALRKAGLVDEQEVTQLYDPEAGTFLADRFVKGTCPKCKSPNQYGDSCDKCGAHYSPTDLIDPVSTLSGSHARDPHGRPPVRQHRAAARLSRTSGRRRGEHLQPEVANYLTGPFPAASRCAIGTSRGRRRISASRFPTARATTGTSGSTRRSATSARPGSGASGTARSFDDWWRSDRDRNPPLHRQGHHLLPHAVLAGHAQDGRLQPARRRSTSTAS